MNGKILKIVVYNAYVPGHGGHFLCSAGGPSTSRLFFYRKTMWLDLNQFKLFLSHDIRYGLHVQILSSQFKVHMCAVNWLNADKGALRMAGGSGSKLKKLLTTIACTAL